MKVVGVLIILGIRDIYDIEHGNRQLLAFIDIDADSWRQKSQPPAPKKAE